MPGDRKKRDRVRHRRDAIDAFNTHQGAILNILSEVIYDLANEVSKLKPLEQDQAYCAELLFRLEHGSRYGDPQLAPLNDVVLVFVAFAAVNVWSAAARRDSSLRRGRLPRIQAQLRQDGTRIARGMQVRLGRQIKELRYRF